MSADGMGPPGADHGPRCSDGARHRSDPMSATAFPAHRLLLVELRGPWLHDAVAQAWPARSGGLGGPASARLLQRAGAAGVRVLAIRRRGGEGGSGPGPDHGPRRWALGDLTRGRAALRWGTWDSAEDLLALDPAVQLTTSELTPSRPPERPVVLVCTHGGHDACCALRGRPVHRALASRPDADVWECSHLGGDRFAGNMLVLPDGLMFGGLDPVAVRGVLDLHLAGRIALPHYRGRGGDDAVAQAAEYHAMVQLDDDRRGAVVVERVERTPGDPVTWVADVHHESGNHRVTLTVEAAPATRLTCGATRVAVARQFRLESFEGLARRAG